MNIGILGCGRIARTMAAVAAKTPGVNAYAAASRSPEKARAFAAENGLDVSYGSYEELLRDRNVDLVYIATPHSRHAADVMLCADYGKPVLCEKPFALNASQARKALCYAEEKGVFVTEAIWPRYMPHAELLRSFAAKGEIGTITSAASSMAMSITENPRLLDLSLGGGALLDVGIYALTFLSMVLGDDVADVSARGGLTEDGVDLEDYITLGFGNGRVGSAYTAITNASSRSSILRGTEGYATIESTAAFGGMKIYDAGGQLVRQVESPNRFSGYAYELMACARVLEEGGTECPEIPHSKTITMMELMDRIRDILGVRYPSAGE